MLFGCAGAVSLGEADGDREVEGTREVERTVEVEMERECAAALVLRRVLASGGYGAAAARARVAPGAPYLNASDLFEARFDERVTSELVGAGDAEGMLLALFGVGVAAARGACARALGATDLRELEEHGLLVEVPTWGAKEAHADAEPGSHSYGLPAGGDDGEVEAGGDDALLASLVQVFPLSLENPCADEGGDDRGRGAEARPGARCAATELLIATDWELESLLPAKWATMAVGEDSLALVHLAPLPAVGEDGAAPRVLDVCCGGGVQGLAAAARCPQACVTCLDINERAVRACRFNAVLNALDGRVRAAVSDGYSALPGRPGGQSEREAEHSERDTRALGGPPFDVILANPPFVAVPPPPAHAHECAEWAAYADGGPDGTRVLSALADGASELLRDGGVLAIVSEYPNMERTHEWLSVAEDMDLAVFYDPAHTLEATEYAEARASERGWPWMSAEAHLASLEAHGVRTMGSGLAFARKVPERARAGSRTPRRVAFPLGGVDGEHGEQLSLLASSGARVRREWQAFAEGALWGAAREQS